MTFPEALKSAIKEKGISQAQLSKMAGISGTTISNYKNGCILPTPESIEKIENALGITFDCDEAKKDIDPPARKKSPREVRLLDALTNLAIRMTNYDNATPSQLSLLLEVSKVLLEHYRAQ